MKHFLGLLFLFFSLSAGAADIEGIGVLMRSVDKVTGRTDTFEIENNKPYQLGNLRITTQRCLKKPPEEPPENLAFILVEEENDQTFSVIFNGWMFSSNPAISAMEHPVYDIWVLECIEPNAEKEKTLPPTEESLIQNNDVEVNELENLDI